MGNGAGGYTGAVSSTGFYGGLIEGLSNLLAAPIYRPLPTRPAQSQVLVSKNSSFVVDPAMPATATHPAGYAVADTWFNPLDPIREEVRYQDNYVWDNTRGKFVNRPEKQVITTPKFYTVRSEVQEDLQPPSSVGYNVIDIFRSPESAVLNTGPCDPLPAGSPVASTLFDRLNRLMSNQFFSPFRARRLGGNSYQAISEAADDIFDPSGRPGVFTPEVVPAVIARQRQERIFRG
jgi:hypothetical protein